MDNFERGDFVDNFLDVFMRFIFLFCDLTGPLLALRNGVFPCCGISFEHSPPSPAFMGASGIMLLPAPNCEGYDASELLASVVAGKLCGAAYSAFRLFH